MPSARLLVAEDDHDYRELLRTWLEHAGYEVVAVNDGGAALDELSRDPSFDGVVADLRMPGVDGRELCRRIRAAPEGNRLPVLVLSAAEDAADISDVVGLGRVWYLGKSAGWEKMGRTLSHLLDTAAPR